MISIVYSIHLLHLGSRKDNSNISKTSNRFNQLYRADILDRNGNYIVKTVSSIDIGISTKKVIDKKKLLINLKYIFPDKNYEKIETYLEKKNFFYFEKKFQTKITKRS